MKIQEANFEGIIVVLSIIGSQYLLVSRKSAKIKIWEENWGFGSGKSALVVYIL